MFPNRNEMKRDFIEMALLSTAIASGLTYLVIKILLA